MKECRLCAQLIEYGAFYFRKDTNTYRSECKNCLCKKEMSKYSRSKLYRNKKKQYAKDYYLGHQAKAIENKQKWTANNRDKVKLYKLKYRKKWLEKPESRVVVSAYNKVARAVRTGKLLRPTECEACYAACKPHAHHHYGYAGENALKVEWLCIKCHRAADRTIGNSAYGSIAYSM